MSKNQFSTLIFLIFLILIIVYFFKNTNSEKELPEFTFFTMEGKEYGRKDLNNNRPVFIYINVDCNICDYELSKLSVLKDTIDSYDIYIVSNSNLTDYIKLLDKYYITSIPYVTILHDRDNTFERSFGVNTVPSCFIYDTTYMLKRYYGGISEIDKFFDDLKKDN